MIAKRLSFIGRKEVLSTISEKIVDSRSWFILVQGPAGIGKTRVLEETERLVVEEAEENEKKLVCLPIIDFYDTAMHSESAIERTIVNSLESQLGNGLFDDFHEALGEFLQGRSKEEDLWKVFKMVLDKVTMETRVVLRFDTAELLEYEHDDPEVLQECEVMGLEAPTLSWLVEKAPELNNTLTLVGSRPSQLVRERFGKASSIALQEINIEGFNLEETQEYFQAAEPFGTDVIKNAPDMVEKIWFLSDGRPIFISLSLDWLERGLWDGEIYPKDIAKLRQMSESNDDAWQTMKQHFEVTIIQKIRELRTPLDRAIAVVTRARKGCDEELLATMMEIDISEVTSIVQELLTLSIVKIPHVSLGWRPKWFFFHDEMYDLVEKYYWWDSYPEYNEQEKIAQKILTYYDKKLEEIELKITQEVTEVQRGDLQRQRMTLLTEKLYYMYDKDPLWGQIEYDRLDTMANNLRAYEWDQFLRAESLRFLRQRWRRAAMKELIKVQNGQVLLNEEINRNCRARWLHRYVARGEYEKVIRIANNLLTYHPNWPKYWQARNLVSKAVAEVRIGEIGGEWLLDDATKDLNDALDLLTKVESEKVDPWLFGNTKGTSWVYKGVIARTLGNLEAAREAYETSGYIFREIKWAEGEARAINNEGYILAIQGKTAIGLTRCQEGLQIRQRIGDARGVALSFNTMGIIRLFMGDTKEAIVQSKKALSIFQKNRDTANMALAKINLGRAFRQRGLTDMRRDAKSAERDYFEESERILKEAIENENKLELYYRVEVHNELGCTYKDLANYLALQHGKRDQYLRLMHAADNEFSVAHHLAANQLKMAMADNLEDWAWVYHLRRAYAEPMNEEHPDELVNRMNEKLSEAETLLENTVDFKPPPHPGMVAYFLMGKIWYQRALFLKKFGQHSEHPEAAKAFAIAATYLETFSPDADELSELLFSVDNWLSKFSPEKAFHLVDVMKKVIQVRESEGWQGRILLEWLDDVVLTSPHFI